MKDTDKDHTLLSSLQIFCIIVNEDLNKKASVKNPSSYKYLYIVTVVVFEFDMLTVLLCVVCLLLQPVAAQTSQAAPGGSSVEELKTMLLGLQNQVSTYIH